MIAKGTWLVNYEVYDEGGKLCNKGHAFVTLVQADTPDNLIDELKHDGKLNKKHGVLITNMTRVSK